jgi:pilus assembly protein CpaE
VRVLLSPPRPEMADLVGADHLKTVLQELRRHFDVVVVDTPKSLSDQVLTILDQADRILVVTTAEIPALRNTKLFLEVADTLKYDKNKILLIVNKYDKRVGGIARQEIEEAIKHKVLAELVLDQVTAVRSVNQGAPIVSGDRTKPLAQGYLQLAARVRKELMPQAEPAGARATADDKGRARLGRLFGSGG